MQTDWKAMALLSHSMRISFETPQGMKKLVVQMNANWLEGNGAIVSFNAD